MQQRVIPYLMYEDAPAALEFLDKAFGFEERFRFPMSDGRIGHAEVVRDESVVMLASVPGELWGGASPKDLPAVHSQIFCYVDDVDAHYERASAAGATIAAPPADQEHGSRVYRALDPEGHRWIFATPSTQEHAAS